MAVSPATGRNDLNKRCIKKDWDEVVRLLLRAAEASPEQKCPLKKERRKPYRRSLLATNREAAGRPSEGSGGTTFNLRRSEKKLACGVTPCTSSKRPAASGQGFGDLSASGS